MGQFFSGSGEHDEFPSPAAAIVTASGACENIVGKGEVDIFHAGCGCMTGAGFDFETTEISGGSEDSEFFNGGRGIPYKGLREYESSISSKLKKEVITRLARALKNVGIDVNPEDDPDKIIKDMKRNIPNPSKGKTFEADATSHEKICKAIAKVLNEQFTPGATKGHQKLIDTNMNPVEICRKVGEWVHSFNIGVNTEFMAVYTSVQNAMRNILVLDAIMDRLFINIDEKIRKSKDVTSIEAETRLYRELYERAKQESRRQKLVLENILNISLPPALKELELAMQQENEYQSIIKRLNVKPGSSKFSDSIAYTISAIGTSAAIAQKVDKALKQLGMNVNEYLNSENFQNFSKMLNTKYIKKVQPGELANIITAVRTLKRYFKDKNTPEFKKILGEIDKPDYISDYPEKYQGRGMPIDDEFIGGREVLESLPVVEDFEGGSDAESVIADPVMEEATGGMNIDIDTLLEQIEVPEKTKMETFVERLKKEKTIIIKDFAKRMTDNYEELSKSIKTIGRMFGKEIPLSELTDELRNAIISLRRMDSDSNELYLVGYYTDARAREYKERFINKFTILKRIVDKIVKKSEYKQFTTVFSELSGIVQEIINTINLYSNEINRNVPTKLDSDELYPDLNDDYEGSGPSEIYSIKLQPELSQDDFENTMIRTSQYTLNTAIADFIYFYYISRVYKNLKNAATELEEIGNTKYTELLGDSVAKKIEKLLENKKKILEHFEDDKIEKAKKYIKEKALVHIIENDNELSVKVAVCYPKGVKSQYELPDYPFGILEKTEGESIILENIIDSNDSNDDNEYITIDYTSILPPVPELIDTATGKPGMLDGIPGKVLLYPNSTIEGVDGLEATDTDYLKGALLGRYQLDRLKQVVPPYTFGKFCFIAHVYKKFNQDISKRLNPPVKGRLFSDPKASTHNFRYNASDIKSIPYSNDDIIAEINNLCGINKLKELGISNGNTPLTTPETYTKPDIENLISNISTCFNKVILMIKKQPEEIKKYILNDSIESNSIKIVGGDETYDYLITLLDTRIKINEKEESIKNHIQEVKKYIEKDFDVKINFYKVVQAIDIYLKEFTIGIAKNPDSIKNISKILDGTQVIANWFNDETGENLWKSFEYMGSVEIKKSSVGNGRNITQTEYENDINNIIKGIYHKPDSKLFDEDREIKDHYYKILYDGINNVNSSTTGITTEYQKIISDPFIGVPCYDPDESNNKAKMSKKYLDKAVGGFQALKNLLNAFFRIGDEFGGGEIRHKTFLSPTQIYKYLMEYIKCSAYFMNYGNASDTPDTKITPMVPEYFVSFSKACSDTNYNNFNEENKLFSSIIKAMSAKILVVLGVYDMFDRRQSTTHLNPIRFIIGGTESVGGAKVSVGSKLTDLSVIPEASELYFRLPRLLEFYKKLLFWRGDGDRPNKISIIPELTSVFGGLVNIIFQKVYSPETGAYSDYDSKLIIHEINYIYNFYKGTPCPEGVCNKIILELVKEINQKIGVIKREDMQKYWDLQRKQRNNPAKVKQYVQNTNYSILPDEGDDEIDGKAPHESYLYKSQDRKTTKKKSEDVKDINRDSNLQVIGELRSNLEDLFNKYKPTGSSFTPLTYVKLINSAKEEMEKLQNPTDKLNTAIKLIQTTKELNLLSDKAFMLHETVVMGLNFLGIIYEMIINFKNIISEIDPVLIEQDIINYFAKGTGLSALKDFDLAKSLDISDIKRKLIYKRAVSANGEPIYDDNGDIIEREFLSERMNATKGQNGIAVDSLMALLDDPRFYKCTINNKARTLNEEYSPEKIKQMYAENDFPNITKYNISLHKDPTMLNNDSYDLLFTRLRIVSKYLVNYQLIMKMFIENLFGFVNGDLITVRFVEDSYTPIQLDFSKLVNTVEGLIEDIKNYINKFRPYMNDDLIKIFENVDNKGSIYWFEKEFIDTMFKGLGKDIKSDKSLDDWDKNSLNQLIKNTNNVFFNLIRDTKVSLPPDFNYGKMYMFDDLTGELIIGELEGNKRIDQAINNIIKHFVNHKNIVSRETYGNLISELIYYNNTSYKEGVENDCLEFPTNYTYYGPLYRHHDKTEVNGSKRHARIENSIEKFLISGRVLDTVKRPTNDSAFKFPPLKYTGRFHIWDKNEFTELKSLMFSFNQLFAMYLTSCIDPMNNKIYGNLISTFANSVGSKSVFNPDVGAYPDLTNYNSMFGRRGDPQYGSVLLASLAHIVQRIITDIKNQIPDFIIGTLTEVPSYMKERYRNNLHYLYKMFETLISKCEFINNLMFKTKLDCTRTSQVLCNKIMISGTDISIKVEYRGELKEAVISSINSVDLLTTDQIKTLCSLDVNSLDSKEAKLRLSQIIKSVIEHAASVNTMITSVLQELGGEQLRYMETSTNFIDTYKQRYNKYPLMPLSHTLYFAKEDICFQSTKNMLKNKKHNDITGLLTMAIKFMNDKDKKSRSLVELVELIDIHIRSTTEYIKNAVKKSEIYEFIADVICKMGGSGHQSLDTSNPASVFKADQQGLHKLQVGEKRPSIKSILKNVDTTGVVQGFDSTKSIKKEEHTLDIQNNRSKQSFMTGYVDCVYNLGFTDGSFQSKHVEDMFKDVASGEVNIKELNSHLSIKSFVVVGLIANTFKSANNDEYNKFKEMMKYSKFYYCIAKICLKQISENLISSNTAMHLVTYSDILLNDIVSYKKDEYESPFLTANHSLYKRVEELLLGSAVGSDYYKVGVPAIDFTITDLNVTTGTNIKATLFSDTVYEELAKYLDFKENSLTSSDLQPYQREIDEVRDSNLFTVQDLTFYQKILPIINKNKALIMYMSNSPGLNLYTVNDLYNWLHKSAINFVSLPSINMSNIPRSISKNILPTLLVDRNIYTTGYHSKGFPGTSSYDYLYHEMGRVKRMNRSNNNYLSELTNEIYSTKESSKQLAVSMFYLHSRNIQKKIIESHILFNAHSSISKDSLWDNSFKLDRSDSDLKTDATIQDLYGTVAEITASPGFYTISNWNCDNSQQCVDNPFMDKLLTYINAPNSCILSYTDSKKYTNAYLTSYMCPNEKGSNFSVIDTFRYIKSLQARENFHKNIKNTIDLLQHYKNSTFAGLEGFFSEGIEINDSLFGTNQFFVPRTYYKILENIIDKMGTMAIYQNCYDNARRIQSTYRFIHLLFTIPTTIDRLAVTKDGDTILDNNYARKSSAEISADIDTLKKHLKDVLQKYTSVDTAKNIEGNDDYNKEIKADGTSANNCSSNALYPEGLFVFDALMQLLDIENPFISSAANNTWKVALFLRMSIDIKILLKKLLLNNKQVCNEAICKNASPVTIQTNPSSLEALMITNMYVDKAIKKHNYFVNGISLLKGFYHLSNIDIANNTIRSSFVYSIKRKEDFLSYLLLKNYCETKDNFMYQVTKSIRSDQIKQVSEKIFGYSSIVTTNISWTVPTNNNFGDIYNHYSNFRYVSDDIDPTTGQPIEKEIDTIANRAGIQRNTIYDFNIKHTDNLREAGHDNINAYKSYVYNCINLYIHRLNINSDIYNDIFENISKAFRKLNDITDNNLTDYYKKFDDLISGVYACICSSDKLKEEKRKADVEKSISNNTYKFKCSTDKNLFRYLEKDILSIVEKSADESSYDDIYGLLLSLVNIIGGDSDSGYIYYTQDNIFKTNTLFGSVDTKLQHGIRPIVDTTTEITYDTYPSIKEFITHFNETVMTDNSIELDNYLEFMKRCICISRYTLDARNFKSYVQSDFWTGIDIKNPSFNTSDRPCPRIVTNYEKVLSDTVISNFERVGKRYTPNNKMRVYSFQEDQKAYNIVFSIENASQEEEISKIIKAITEITDKGDMSRMSECINNLLDLNLMPLNVNVLMTDIPLINLYNYDYTFELMTSSMYGKDHKKLKNKTKALKPKDTQEAFLSLLYHPYLEINQSYGLSYSDMTISYYEYISRIMRGDNNLGLGRPKFLSDQIFNKVLLRSIYPSTYAQDEAGPIANINILKGYSKYNSVSMTTMDQFGDSGILTYPYINDKKKFELKSVSFDPEVAMYLDFIGKKRFDSTIIRNLFFIVNVLRITRLKLSKDLSTDRNVIVNSHYAVAPNLTEYGNYPFTPNEMYDSTTVEGEKRFDKDDEFDNKF